MSKPSVLVIGCGSIGERHVRCFLGTGRVSVTACDAAPATVARMKQSYPVETATDWQPEVASGRHAIAIVCTPAPLHLTMATRALRAGLHVLIEKPLSHAFAGVDELVAARDGSGRQAAVAYVFYVNPALKQARDFLARQPLGPLLQATVTTGQPFHRLRPAYAGTYYRDRAMGGGAIQDALTHSANWIESVLGPTESVLCDCAHLALPDVEVEDTVHISARHRGAICNYSLNQFQAPNETFFQFNAAGGSLRVESHLQRWGTFAAGDTEWKWRNTPPLDRDTPFLAQANAFLDLVEGRPSSLCSLEAGIQTLRFNLAALASAASGSRVACASFS